jgi:hypothetical protein
LRFNTLQQHLMGCGSSSKKVLTLSGCIWTFSARHVVHPKNVAQKKTVLCQRPVDTVVYITSIVNCDAVCACIVCMLCLNIPLANKHTCAVYNASVHLEIATSMSKVFPFGKCFSDKIWVRLVASACQHAFHFSISVANRVSGTMYHFMLPTSKITIFKQWSCGN